jgi:septum formation topological specificity factor MinE
MGRIKVLREDQGRVIRRYVTIDKTYCMASQMSDTRLATMKTTDTHPIDACADS